MDEVTISDGPIDVAVLPEAGARIHRLRAFGHDLLRTPATTAEHLREPFSWGAYVMAPWCNRVDAGRLAVGSRQLALDSNFADGSAIHGQVYVRPWKEREDGAFHVSGGGDGWPWEYDVSLRVEVVDTSVRINLSLVNRSSDPMPAGLGIHPWFRRPLRVAIHGEAVYPLNTATRADPEPVRGRLDLREMGEMAEGLDATWTDLADPPVEMAWPDLGIRATMRISAPTIYVVAASSAKLDAIAVEPQTHAPHGIRRLLNGEPGSLMMLDPGQALELGVGLQFARSDD